MKILDAPLPPPSRRSFHRVALFVGLSVFFVLAVFQPFGTHAFEHNSKYLLLFGYAVVIVGASVLAWEIVAWAWHRKGSGSGWTFGHELGMLLFVFVVAASASHLYQIWLVGGRLSLSGYVSFMLVAASTGFFPMLLLLALRYMKAKTELEKAALLAQKTAPTPPPTLTLQGENKYETLTVLKSELLVLRSADNYVEIFLQKGPQVQRLMLRGSLSRMLEQIADADFRQVHRSFVVNFGQRISLTGKSPAYRLVFEGLPESELDPVPVSQSQVAAVREALAQKPK
ncbi:MAG: LytTR family DNA-binding domain-containing protein [Saprospiraceae bacterium]